DIEELSLVHKTREPNQPLQTQVSREPFEHGPEMAVSDHGVSENVAILERGQRMEDAVDILSRLRKAADREQPVRAVRGRLMRNIEEVPTDTDVTDRCSAAACWRAIQQRPLGIAADGDDMADATQRSVHESRGSAHP